jgi:hypothetical protein
MAATVYAATTAEVTGDRVDAAERAVYDLLVALGHDPATPAPRRYTGTGGVHVCRAPLHVPARRARARCTHGHLRSARLLRHDARSRQEFFALTGISR